MKGNLRTSLVGCKFPSAVGMSVFESPTIEPVVSEDRISKGSLGEVWREEYDEAGPSIV